MAFGRGGVSLGSLAPKHLVKPMRELKLYCSASVRKRGAGGVRG